MIISIMSQQKSNFREEQWDWAAVFHWSSQPIIPTSCLAASDFLDGLDDNVLRQAATVMTISLCAAVLRALRYALICWSHIQAHSTQILGAK